MRAAAAWGIEALVAERWEARHIKRQALPSAAAEERALSENPDRGLASQA